MKNITAKKKLNVVDVFIIIILALALVGVGARFLLIKNTPSEVTLPDVQEKEYLVSYVSRELRGSVVNYLKEGTEFRFYTSNKPFGTTYGTPTTDDPVRQYKTTDGLSVSVKNLAELSTDGKDISHLKRYDIEGKFLVKGKLTKDENGILVITGSEGTSIALNKALSIRSDDMVISITVTSITPIE